MGMGISRLSPRDVAVEAVETLGLDPSVDLMSPEGLAASIRRAASFSCPTTPGTLLRAVSEVLVGLPGFDDEKREQMAELIESLLAHGDLLELPDEDGRQRQLFLGPPAYVPRRGSNSCLLIGIRPEGALLVSDELAGEIQYNGHARILRLPEDESLGELLDEEGLTKLAAEHWLQTPRAATPKELVAFYIDKLHTQGLTGDVELRIIDPDASVTYYRGRWGTPRGSDSGYFVARRPQAFGADLWCFAELAEGAVAKLVDLPQQKPLAPAADEAWRLQAAIDALAATPQRVRVAQADDASARILDFFSPVPSWIQRRLDVIGTLHRGRRGALFSYELPEGEVEEEIDFLQEQMWLSPMTERTAGD
jgi:hypothetical protein